MNYCVYKLTFPQGAHFGNGTLDETSFTFPADKLFSALYIEALKAGCEGTLLESAEKGRLLLSDALPFVGSQYLVPKPILYVERAKNSDVEDRKKYKKRKYLTLAELDAYMDGTLNLSDDPMAQFGMESSQTKIHLIPGEDAMPYYVGAYHYRRGNGLYLILAYEAEEDQQLIEELLDALSYTGIGGKKSTGLGKFDFRRAKEADIKSLKEALGRKRDWNMLLSSAFPQEDELENAMEGASYLLEKRSGFVASEDYADTFRRKRDMYVFAAGSCFKERFAGDIFDVSDGGRHPVYRYAKALFLGV